MQAGQWVSWRNPAEARHLGWEESFGPGPFQVVACIDRTADGIPNGVIVKTRLGEREINTLCLVPADEPA
jgi:hypothetical protein